MNKKIRVAAYCRVSTEKEDQLASLDTQKAFFKEYTDVHNYELVNVYADEGISGTKLKNRHAFNKMLADAKLGMFERVFVKDVSRFSRNAVDFLQSIRELKALGIKCDFVNANLSTEDGEFALGLLALVAQEESANLSKRVKFGKAKNAQNGKVPNLVYGYDKTIGELFRLEINEFEANIVKRIYEMYVEQGFGTNKIAQTLNNEGIVTKRGCRWSSNATSRILSNPIYIGKVINGKESVNDFLTGVRTKQDSESWIIRENPELSIIDIQTFEKAQNLLSCRKDSFKLDKERESCKYPLSMLIKCSCCGYSFRRVYRKFKSKEYIKWTCCGSNINGKDFCNNKTKIDEDELLEAIHMYLCNIIKNKEGFVSSIALELEKLDIALPDKKQLQDKLIKIKKTKSKYMEMYAAEVISMQELKEATESVNEDIVKYEKALENISEQDVLYSSREDAIKKYCKDIESLLSKENLDNQLLRQVIEKIVVSEDGEVEIYLKVYSDLSKDCMKVSASLQTK
ncbi:recombinase family protein [Anaerotignum sp.]|uniref:recombinase family protein n=1 Tax=Anaerotignum sp. TaxID=2039241 RepID=UPI0028AB02B9|nr:recombinase family protein [Anaerotignum sp.]